MGFHRCKISALFPAGGRPGNPVYYFVNSFMFSFCCFVLVCVRLHVRLPASPGSRHQLSEADEDEELLEDNDLLHLLQRLSVAMQRGNAAAVLGTSAPG